MALIDMLPATPGAMESDFKIFTGAMEIASDGSPARDPVVRMVGSSTEEDLHGDFMRQTALEDMTRVDPNLLIWLNHSYDLPEDLFGALVETPRIQRAIKGISDLHLAVEVETSNPRAMQTYGFIQRKSRRLGCSVGCQVLEFAIPGVDPEDEEEMFWSMLMGAPIEIIHVKTVEWSIVGIPANQRSWVENAINGLFQRSLDMRLAPAAKGLFPADYRKAISRIEDPDLRQKYLDVPARGSKGTLKWNFERSLFEFRSRPDQKAPDQDIERESVGDFITQKAAEKPAMYLQTLLKKSGGIPVTAGENTIWVAKGGQAWIANPTSTSSTTVIATETAITDHTNDLNLDPQTEAEVEQKSGLEVITESDPQVEVKAEVEGHAEVEAETKASDPDNDNDDDSGSKGDSAHEAQESRSSKYHIGVKEGGNVTKPSKWSSVPDSEWGDPVNYRYPMPDESHARNALSRWGDASNRSQYNESEQGIITARIHRRCSALGVEVSEEDKAMLPDMTKEYASASDVMCDADGNHDPVIGTHSHMHMSYGAYNTSDTHSHQHDHSGDNDHSPDGRMHVHEPGGMGPGDGNIDPPRSAEPEHTFSEDARAQMLKQYEALGTILGIEKIEQSPEPTLRVEGLEDIILKALNIVKSGKEFSDENLESLQHVHDTLDAMCSGALCKGKLTEPGDEGKTTQQVADEARQSRDRDDTIPSMGTTMALGNIIKSLEGVTKALGTLDIKGMDDQLLSIRAGIELSKKEIGELAVERSQLRQAIEDLTNMPLGRPTGLQRAVQSDPAAASYQDMMILPNHDNEFPGTTIVYRKGIGKCRLWPESASDRPELTSSQIIGMENRDISNYQKGLEALVPLL